MKKVIMLASLASLTILFASGAFASKQDGQIRKAKVNSVKQISDKLYELKYSCISGRGTNYHIINVRYKELVDIDYMSEPDFIQRYCK